MTKGTYHWSPFQTWAAHWSATNAGKAEVSRTIHVTRAGPGNVWTPLRFLGDLFMHPFLTCCENFKPKSLKVRLSGHIKWPHLRKRLNGRHSYNWPIALKLSAIDMSNSFYKVYASEFWYRWARVRPILRPLHYKSMGENWKAPLLDENHSKHFQVSNIDLQWPGNRGGGASGGWALPTFLLGGS